MMSYDGCCFFWHQHAQDGNHTFSKNTEKLAMTKAMQHFFHNGKGNESHEKH